MIKVLACLLILLTTKIGIAAETNADFYVSPTGSDKWSGQLAEPNAQQTDGPFATLERARDAVRELKQEQAKNIVVLIRGGSYQLSKTIVFGLEDSGVGKSTITYAAFPGETPVFTSGKQIQDWKKVSEKLPGLPAAADGKLMVAKTSDRFLTLYDADGLLPRARSKRHVPKGSSTELRFSKGQLKNWPNVTDVEILVRPTRLWTMNILPLVSVDERKGVARTAIPATYGMNKLGFWVENVLEELDEPGEWVLNTKDGKVYLWPRNESPVMAPQLIEFIRVEGKIDKQGPKIHRFVILSFAVSRSNTASDTLLPKTMLVCSTIGTCSTKGTRWCVFAEPTTASSSSVIFCTAEAVRSVWTCMGRMTGSLTTVSSI